MDATTLGFIIAGEGLLFLSGLYFFTYGQLKRARHTIHMLRTMLRNQQSNRNLSGQKTEHYSSSPPDRPSSLLDFISSELEKTRQRYKQKSTHRLLELDPNDPMPAQVAALRATFLEAEKMALTQKDSKQDFWRSFEVILTRILEAYKSKALQAKNPEQAQKWQQKLDEHITQVNNLKRYQQDYYNSQQALKHAQNELTKLEHIDTINEGHLEEINELMAEIERLRISDELGLNGEHPHLLKPSKNETQSAHPAPETQKHIHVSSSMDVSFTKNKEKQGLAIADLQQSAGRSDREVSRLKSICKDQKDTIQTLRQKLINLPQSGESDQDDDHHIDVQQLSRMLKESETCIDMLEAELSSMQGRLHFLEESNQKLSNEMHRETEPESQGQSEIDVQKTQDASKAIAELERKLAQHKERLKHANQSAKESGHIIQYARNLIACSKLAEIAENLLKTLNVLGGNGCLQLSSESEKIHAADYGSISSKDKNILRSLTSRDPVIDLGDNTLLNYPATKVLIKDTPSLSKSELGRLKDNMVIIAELTEQRIKGIQINGSMINQHDKVTHLVDNSRKALNNIDIQWQYYSSEAKLVLDNMMENIDLTLSTSDITAAQAQQMQDILDEAKERFAIMFTTSSISKQLNDVFTKISEAVALPLSPGEQGPEYHI
jgi:hypothetical protein